MTKKELIDGLKMTVDLFLFDPLTGEVLTKEHLNGESRITVEACEGAIAILEAALCGDCISRQAAIDEINHVVIKFPGLLTDRQQKTVVKTMQLMKNAIENALIKMPSAEPEGKTGKWIIHSDDLFPAESTQECDQCHVHQPLDWRCSDNYCPSCGAKMIEPQESEDEE